MNSNILIRKAKFGDAQKLAEMIKFGLKTKNFDYIGANKPWDKKKIDKVNNSYKTKESLSILAFDKSTKEVVGNCSCMFKKTGRLRHRGECGWTVHPNYQGQGIATKLLNELIKEAKKIKLKRLDAEIAIKNKASVKLAKKCGFKIEGIKKAGLLTDENKFIDTYIVGKLLK